MTDEFDVIVIGGGAAGENVAAGARRHDLSVALVERALVGGECTYWACMPSKALLRPGEVLAAARRVPAASSAITGGVDAEAAFGSRDAFSANWDDQAQVDWVEATGTTLLRGHARLAGVRRVRFEAPDGTVTELAARRAVVLATGTSASIPPIDGLADARAWDSRDVTSATVVPARLLVLGGGVVGVEMAQAFRRLGAEQVTIVESGDRLLATEEPFVGEHLAEAFAAEGIKVLTGVTATKVSRDGGDGPVTLTLDDGRTLVGDELLVATGRSPNTDDLGLDTVGLERGQYVETDDQLRVTAVDGDWLYAVGDVNGRALLTHHGKYQARIVGDHLGGLDVAATADRDAVVRVVYTDPQVAAVGLTEAAAYDRDIDVEVLSFDFGSTAGGALLGKGTSGTAQLVVDRARRTIVGATFTGPGVGEMIHAATIAIVGSVTLDDLWHAVPAFPTMSEVWLRLLETRRGTA